MVPVAARDGGGWCAGDVGVGEQVLGVAEQPLLGALRFEGRRPSTPPRPPSQRNRHRGPGGVALNKSFRSDAPLCRRSLCLIPPTPLLSFPSDDAIPFAPLSGCLTAVFLFQNVLTGSEYVRLCNILVIIAHSEIRSKTSPLLSVSPLSALIASLRERSGLS